MAPLNPDVGISTRSLHADDAFNVATDVAPPLHVATTYRYAENPDDLVPARDRDGVCLSTLYHDVSNRISSERTRQNTSILAFRPPA